MIKLRYPLPKRYPITFRFGPSRWLGKFIGRWHHNGLDLDSPTGTPALAAHGGLVIFRGWDKKGGGNLIIIRHGNYETLYAHLHSFNVNRGARVKVGQKIGKTGKSGKVTGDHLHFGFRRITSWEPFRTKYLDPYPLLYPAKPKPSPKGLDVICKKCGHKHWCRK